MAMERFVAGEEKKMKNLLGHIGRGILTAWRKIPIHLRDALFTLLLLSALRRAGVACEAHLFEHGVHGTSISTAEVDAADRHRARWVTLCLEWLGRTFGFDLR